MAKKERVPKSSTAERFSKKFSSGKPRSSRTHRPGSRPNRMPFVCRLKSAYGVLAERRSVTFTFYLAIASGTASSGRLILGLLLAAYYFCPGTSGPVLLVAAWCFCPSTAGLAALPACCRFSKTPVARAVFFSRFL